MISKVLDGSRHSTCAQIFGSIFYAEANSTVSFDMKIIWTYNRSYLALLLCGAIFDHEQLNYT